MGKKYKTIREAQKIIHDTPDDFAAASDLYDVVGDEFPDLNTEDLADSLKLLERKKKQSAKSTKSDMDISAELDDIINALNSVKKSKSTAKKAKITKKTSKRKTTRRKRK